MTNFKHWLYQKQTVYVYRKLVLTGLLANLRWTLFSYQVHSHTQSIAAVVERGVNLEVRDDGF